MKDNFACPYCGYKNNICSNFCNKCGKKITGVINKNVEDIFFKTMKETYHQYLSNKDMPDEDKIPFFISSIILDKSFYILDKTITNKNKYYSELFLNTYVMLFVLLYVEIRMICLSILKDINNIENEYSVKKSIELIESIFIQFILYGLLEYLNNKKINIDLHNYKNIDEWYSKNYNKYISLICNNNMIDYNSVAYEFSNDICNMLKYKNISFDKENIYQIFKDYIIYIDTYLKNEVNRIFSSKLYLWIDNE